MREQIFHRIECPIGLNECNGLAVSVNGSGIEIQQKDNCYVTRTREGKEEFGNCPHYQDCYNRFILSQGPIRRPAEIKPSEYSH